MHNRWNRRQFLKGMAAGAGSLLAASLAACGTTGAPAAPGAADSGATEAGGAAEAPAQTGGVKNVRALAWSNGPAIDEHFNQRVKAFNAAHEGAVSVDLQFLPYDQYWQKIDLAYASNQPYDIYYWDVQAYAHYKKGLLSDLQPYLQTKPDILDSANYPVHLYEPWKFDGAHLYGMPENLQTMVLFFNKDLFDKAGYKYPDENWTWDDVLTAARQLTIREGDRVTQWGMDMGDMSIWWGLQTLSWAQDDAFFDKVLEPTKFNMSSPANVQSMRFIQDLIWKEKVAPNAAQRQAVGQDVGIFQSGKTAIYPGGGWNIASYASLPFKWDIAPLPKWKTKRVVPYWLGGWVIPKDSKVADAAFEYAHWSATAFQPQMAKDHDWVPLQNKARTSPEMLAGMPEGFKVSLDAISSAKIGDLYHRNSQQILNEVLGPVLTQVWENKLTPEEAGKQIDEQANELLQKA
jgi:multiple sugar transport system substrate-binding protein